MLHLIQTGVLVGTFYLWKYCLSFLVPSLLSLGIVLTIILFLVSINDWEDAKRNDSSMHKLGDSLGIRRTAERWNFVFIRSHILLYAVVILFIFVDVRVLFYFSRMWGIWVALGLVILALLICVLKHLKILRRETDC